MSLLVASVIASASSLASSNQAQKDADKIQMYSDLISIEEQAQTNAIEKLNITRDVISVESAQSAQASAMGKRASSASIQNMQSIAREDVAKNFERMDESIKLSRDMGMLNAQARESATRATEKSANLNLFASTLRSGLLLKGTGK